MAYRGRVNNDRATTFSHSYENKRKAENSDEDLLESLESSVRIYPLKGSAQQGKRNELYEEGKSNGKDLSTNSGRSRRDDDTGSHQSKQRKTSSINVKQSKSKRQVDSESEDSTGSETST
jgi:hypothetical protein